MFVFGVILIFDMLIGDDCDNLFEVVVLYFECECYYWYIVYFVIFVEYVVFFMCVWIVGMYVFVWYDYVGFVLLFGVVIGILINIVYEFGYKIDCFECWFVKIMFVLVVYGYFYVEYNCGYYVCVVMVEDLVSVCYGELFWVFLLCMVIGSICLVWWFEKVCFEWFG